MDLRNLYNMLDCQRSDLIFRHLSSEEQKAVLKHVESLLSVNQEASVELRKIFRHKDDESLVELRERARKLGFKGYTRLSKQELSIRLELHDLAN